MVHIKKLCFLFLPILAITVFAQESFSEQNYKLYKLKLGLSFPPIKNQKQMRFSQKNFKELGVSMIRTEAHWANREPEKGQFIWRAMDEKLAFLKRNNIKIMLTIGSYGPEWACSSKRTERSCIFKDKNDFKDYLTALLKRYPNEIDKIQFGNEWQTEFWFAGTAQEYTEFNNILYDITKKISPKTKVVLGGFSIGALRHLAGCERKLENIIGARGENRTEKDFARFCESNKAKRFLNRVNYVLENAKYDIVDIHLYDDVENWDVYYDVIAEKTKGKEIIVSEFGGPNILVEKYTDDYQAKRLYEYIKNIDSLGIKEAYYFKLVEGKKANPAHRKSGLFDRNIRKKLAYDVFKNFNKEAQH